MVFTASLLCARHLEEVVQNKPASLLVSLGKGRPHFYVAERWPRHLENGHSQASVDVPSET